MYTKYAERQNLSVRLIHLENGKATLHISGKRAISLFKHEPGKHVVQRCPPTEKKGRRQTSTVSVSVLPLVAENQYSIHESELETKTQRGSGPGGQHQNTTDSCVRMTHTPTGITVVINGRDQHSNKKEARGIIESRVQEFYASRDKAVRDTDKSEQVDGGGRGNKVRTYNFLENRVADHRLGTKTTKLKRIMKGELEILYESKM